MLMTSMIGKSDIFLDVYMYRNKLQSMAELPQNRRLHSPLSVGSKTARDSAMTHLTPRFSSKP